MKAIVNWFFYTGKIIKFISLCVVAEKTLIEGITFKTTFSTKRIKLIENKKDSEGNL